MSARNLHHGPRCWQGLRQSNRIRISGETPFCKRAFPRTPSPKFVSPVMAAAITGFWNNCPDPPPCLSRRTGRPPPAPGPGTARVRGKSAGIPKECARLRIPLVRAGTTGPNVMYDPRVGRSAPAQCGRSKGYSTLRKPMTCQLPTTFLKPIGTDLCQFL